MSGVVGDTYGGGGGGGLVDGGVGDTCGGE